MEEDAKKPGTFELLDQKTKVGTLFFYVLNHASQSAHQKYLHTYMPIRYFCNPSTQVGMYTTIAKGLVSTYTHY